MTGPFRGRRGAGWLLRVAALLLPLALPLAAQADFAAGYAAFRQGDFATAATLLRPEAEQGDRRAQYLLGHLLRTGQGVAADPAEAQRWLSAAAADPAPDRFALFELGAMAERGEGMAADPARAAAFYAAAARQGVAAAMLNLGVLTARGQGVTRDLGRALLLFWRAAEGGAPRAMEFFTQLAGGAGGTPPVAGRWQVIDYRASADDLTLQQAAAVLPDIIGKDLNLGRNRFSFGAKTCRRPVFLSEPESAAALLTRSAGATLPQGLAADAAALAAAQPVAVVCGTDLAATLAVLPDRRILASALGGYLLLEPRPSERVAAVQNALAAAGFDPGPGDGIYGRRTGAAVRAYQAAAGLPVTGALTARLVQSLAAALPATTP